MPKNREEENCPPNLSGWWRVEGYYIDYETPNSPPVDLKNPNIYGPINVKIRQYDRFFTYTPEDSPYLPKIGVFEKVYMNGKFIGWKAHMVNTRVSNSQFLFNFTKIRSNKVITFEITYDKAGFSSNPLDIDQYPRVEYVTGKRLSSTKK